MELIDYLKPLPKAERERFAEQVGTTWWCLRNVAYRQRVASAALAAQIEIHSEGRVPVSTLRPKDWQKIWDPRRNHLVYSRAIVGEKDAQSSAALGDQTHAA